MTGTQLVELDIKDLIKADWNYKTEGTPEQIQVLCNSIEADKSAGVPAVREIDGKFEVIDGNHRLEAIIQLGWSKVPCENFGTISKAAAIVIARRRNHKWFDDDVVRLSTLFKEEVMTEYDIDQLTAIMPESREEVEALIKLTDYDWDSHEDTGAPEPTGDAPDDDTTILAITIPEATAQMWKDWKERLKDNLDIETDEMAFQYAMINLEKLPDAELTK